MPSASRPPAKRAFRLNNVNFETCTAVVWYSLLALPQVLTNNLGVCPGLPRASLLREQTRPSLPTTMTCARTSTSSLMNSWRHSTSITGRLLCRCRPRSMHACRARCTRWYCASHTSCQSVSKSPPCEVLCNNLLEHVCKHRAGYLLAQGDEVVNLGNVGQRLAGVWHGLLIV